MLNVTFTALMLSAYQYDAAPRADCKVVGHPPKLAVAAKQVIDPT